jgi:hypothetical protein
MATIPIGLKKQGALKQGLSQDEVQVNFAENLRDSTNNKDLSNETTLSLIHLARKYL